MHVQQPQKLCLRKSPCPSLQPAEIPNKSMASISAEDGWLFQSPSVSWREKNERRIKRHFKGTYQRKSLADVAVYFDLVISILHRRVLQPGNRAGSSARSRYSSLLPLPWAGCPTQRSAMPKSRSVACGLLHRFLGLTLPQSDLFGFINTTGLAKEQPRILLPLTGWQ